MKMKKFSTFVKSEIIAQARAGLEELETEQRVLSTKTDQQRELDTIFARHSNDNTWSEFAEVVKAITGYRPATAPEVRKNFQILYRSNSGNGTPHCWIVLKNNNSGFGAITHGHYYVGQPPVGDRVATLKEAKDFIKSLEQIPADDLVNWIIRQLGPDTLTLL